MFLAMILALVTAFPCSSVTLPNTVAFVVWAVVDVIKVKPLNNNKVSAIVAETADCHTGRRLS